MRSPRRKAPSVPASLQRSASEAEPNDPFIEDFSNEVMCMSYLYSKLPETGVSPHIGTGGRHLPPPPFQATLQRSQLPVPVGAGLLHLQPLKQLARRTPRLGLEPTVQLRRHCCKRVGAPVSYTH